MDIEQNGWRLCFKNGDTGKENNPGWKPGDAFDTSILDQMDDTFGGLDFKV